MQEYRSAVFAGALLAACLVLSPTPGLQAWEAERVLASAARFGPRTLAAARELQQLVERSGSLDEGLRLKPINDFFNQRIAFREDRDIWAKPDYWASPLETLDRGQGDCEDYAIAKYFSLLAAGVPEARLRLVYVRAMLDGRPQAHMVLAYYAQPEAEPLILDNLQAEVRPASQRADLAPVFSFNSEGLWQGVGSASSGNAVARLSIWRDALAKIRAEGF
ncbi:transglutaminase-like cysteine peptidase [Roseateles cavernae]|uniref:transglutaminase-like cysteine peptidase n=1 Tax=Roseateles cavernae TaxID=3153578 RepID=UPI0032E4BDF4